MSQSRATCRLSALSRKEPGPPGCRLLVARRCHAARKELSHAETCRGGFGCLVHTEPRWHSGGRKGNVRSAHGTCLPGSGGHGDPGGSLNRGLCAHPQLLPGDATARPGAAAGVGLGWSPDSREDFRYLGSRDTPAAPPILQKQPRDHRPCSPAAAPDPTQALSGPPGASVCWGRTEPRAAGGPPPCPGSGTGAPSERVSRRQEQVERRW